jgi:N-acyl-L-homoserine lactone synthetase
MILCLKGSERSEKSQYFERMFRLRHEVFIKGLKWPLPSVGGLEIDQYDGPDAVYFLDLTDEDYIQASVRLMPSVSCSLVADYFPGLLENGVSPRHPSVFECTRYMVIPQKGRRRENYHARARVLSAMVEWGLLNNVSYIQCVVDITMFPGFVEMVPWTVPMGLAHPYGGGCSAPGGGNCIAFRWPVTMETVDAIRSHGGMHDHAYSFFGATVAASALAAVH